MKKEERQSSVVSLARDSFVAAGSARGSSIIKRDSTPIKSGTMSLLFNSPTPVKRAAAGGEESSAEGGTAEEKEKGAEEGENEGGDAERVSTAALSAVAEEEQGDDDSSEV